MSMATKRKQATFTSNKIDTKPKTVTRDKEGHNIKIKGSVHWKDITIINIHALNIRVPKYMKQTVTELKGEIDSNTIIVGDIDIPLSIMDRTYRQKVNKETECLNNTKDQTGLINIYKEHSA